jgi:hypothetical protein
MYVYYLFPNNNYVSFLYCRLNEEFRSLRLSDLRVITTLGVGGFGRVELVQIAGDPSRSFALKQMKKSQVMNL